jgi:uncharacterized protein YjiS (DUF1127 family)
MPGYWIDTISPSTVLRSAVSPPTASGRPMGKLMGYFAEWRARARSRHLLQQLDDRMLRDVGLSRADVARECAKNFWQR